MRFLILLIISAFTFGISNAQSPVEPSVNMEECPPLGVCTNDVCQSDSNEFCHNNVCICRVGFANDAEGNCRTSCKEDPDACKPTEFCDRTVCKCREGYALDPYGNCTRPCDDIHRCVDSKHTCVHGFCRCKFDAAEIDGVCFDCEERCLDDQNCRVVNGWPTCVCNPGMVIDDDLRCKQKCAKDSACKELDEDYQCFQKKSICDCPVDQFMQDDKTCSETGCDCKKSEVCVKDETLNQAECICVERFARSFSNECRACTLECDKTTHKICTFDQYDEEYCDCRRHYRMEGGDCKRLCKDHSDCKYSENCENEKCVCREGFEEIDRVCRDINECDNPLVCPDRLDDYCLNYAGSYECLFGHCSDCELGVSICGEDGECEPLVFCEPNECDNPNQFCSVVGNRKSCECDEGYELIASLCKDVDECDDKSSCLNRECTNSPGSFECGDCLSGYKEVTPQGQVQVICTDINECDENDSPACPNGECTNTDGSFTCACDTGYELEEGSQQTCVLIVDASGLSTGGKAGTAIAVLGIVSAVAVGGWMYHKKSGESDAAVPRGVTSSFQNERIDEDLQSFSAHGSDSQRSGSARGGTESSFTGSGAGSAKGSAKGSGRGSRGGSSEGSVGGVVEVDMPDLEEDGGLDEGNDDEYIEEEL